MTTIRLNVQDCIQRLTPSHKTLQRGFLVCSVALSALSIVPSLRLPAALALRSIACLSSVSIAGKRALTASHPRLVDYLDDIKKIAIVALGLTGLILASPLLLMISIVAETALQAFACIKAFYYQNYERGFIHLGLFIVGALTIGATVSGAWPVIVTAAVVNAIVMVGIMLKVASETNFDHPYENWIELACYTLLAMVSLTAAGMSAEVHEQRISSGNFKITNDSDKSMTIVGRDGKPLDTIEPHQTKEITVPIQDFAYYRRVFGYIEGNDQKIEFVRDSYNFETSYYQSPVPAHEIPTVPVSGAVLATEETFSE